MTNKLDVKELIKIGLILFAITAVAAALLAFVNSKTAPLIEQNAIIKEQNAIKTVMSEAAEFNEIEVTPDIEKIAEDEGGKIEKAFAALDADENMIGVCVITNTTGYDIGIETVTGVNSDLTVSGIDIISMNETPGLGANASKPEFKEQYEGKTKGITVSKSSSDGNQIHAISGATKTSNGITTGVNIAIKAAENILNGGDR